MIPSIGKRRDVNSVFRKTAVVPAEEAVGGACPSKDGWQALG